MNQVIAALAYPRLVFPRRLRGGAARSNIRQRPRDAGNRINHRASDSPTDQNR